MEILDHLSTECEDGKTKPAPSGVAGAYHHVGRVGTTDVEGGGVLPHVGKRAARMRTRISSRGGLGEGLVDLVLQRGRRHLKGEQGC